MHAHPHLTYRAQSRFSSRYADVVVLTNHEDTAYRFDEAEYHLATLFDGTRDIAAIAAQAAADGESVTADDMHRFAIELDRAGLLEDFTADAATDTPASTEAATTAVDGSDAQVASRAGVPRPPRAVDWTADAAARAAQPLIASRFARREALRASKSPVIHVHVPVSWLLWAGRLLNLPMRHPVGLLLLAAAAVFALMGLRNDIVQVALDLDRVLRPMALGQLAVVGLLTVNLFGQVARAAAYQRVMGAPPAFGITLLARLLPRFYADVNPAAVRDRGMNDTTIPRPILAASLVATASLFVLAIYGWYLSRGGATVLPAWFAAVALLSGVVFLLRLNPLARYEGYQLLAARLGTPDLRDVALGSLIGRGRIWRRFKPAGVPTRVLRIYALAVFVWVITVVWVITDLLGVWLTRQFGGTGAFLFLTICVIAMWNPFRRLLARNELARDLESRNPEAAARRRSQRRGRLIRWGVVLLVLVVLAFVPYTYEPSGDFTVLPNARSDVRALISGEVREIHVTEGAIVAAGDLLAKLSDDEARARVATSQARLARLEAEMAGIKRGPKPEELALAEQRVATARQRLAGSQADADRLSAAAARGASTGQAAARAQAQAALDAERLAEAQQALEVLRAGPADEEVAALQAEIDAEQAQLDYARQQLRYTEIRAPRAGRVVAEDLRYAIGSYLDRGDLLLTLAETGDVTAEIRVPEADIGDVAVGAPATARAWAYPGVAFTGTVTAIAPNAERADYGRIVRVQMTIDNGEGRLRPEMTGQAKITGDTYPAVIAFTRMISRFLQVEVWSWLP